MFVTVGQLKAAEYQACALCTSSDGMSLSYLS